MRAKEARQVLVRMTRQQRHLLHSGKVATAAADAVKGLGNLAEAQR